MIKPGSKDRKASTLITGLELDELQRFVWMMTESFGLLITGAAFCPCRLLLQKHAPLYQPIRLSRLPHVLGAQLIAQGIDVLELQPQHRQRSSGFANHHLPARYTFPGLIAQPNFADETVVEN